MASVNIWTDLITLKKVIRTIKWISRNLFFWRTYLHPQKSSIRKNHGYISTPLTLTKRTIPPARGLISHNLPTITPNQLLRKSSSLSPPLLSTGMLFKALKMTLYNSTSTSKHSSSVTLDSSSISKNSACKKSTTLNNFLKESLLLRRFELFMNQRLELEISELNVWSSLRVEIAWGE